MFVAIDRENGIFDKEASDQINVRINNLSNATKSISQNKYREHYYDNVNFIKIDYDSLIEVKRDASFQYGKVLSIDFAFDIKNASRTIGTIPNYEMPYDVYVNCCDKEGNITPVVIKQNGQMQFAALPNNYGECAIYCIIIKAA